MKIKEVERTVGITSANIRFYEKEGLIAPHRNGDNNYREYSKEDVERLGQIKFLRILGISVQDIRLLLEGNCELDEVIRKRQEEMKQEAEHLRELQEVCGTILKTGVDLEHLDYSMIDEENSSVKKRLEEILTEDTAKYEITRQSYYQFIWKWIAAALLLDAVICYSVPDLLARIVWLGGGDVNLGNSMFYIMKDIVIFPFLVVISVFTALAALWTAKMWALYVNFILASLELPLFLYLLNWIITHDFENIRYESTAFFIGAAVYVILFGMCLGRWKQMQRNGLYGAAGALVYSLLIGFGYYLTAQRWIDWVFWMVFSMIFLMYISVTTVVETRYRSTYNKYTGIVTAINTVNFLAVLISAQGRTKSWRRDGREFH